MHFHTWKKVYNVCNKEGGKKVWECRDKKCKATRKYSYWVVNGWELTGSRDCVLSARKNLSKNKRIQIRHTNEYGCYYWEIQERPQSSWLPMWETEMERIGFGLWNRHEDTIKAAQQQSLTALKNL